MKPWRSACMYPGLKEMKMRLLFMTASVLCLISGRALIAADNCSAERSWGNEPTAAESREQRVPAAAATVIKPSTNGGVRIHGWNQPDVLVKACIHASAASESEANALLKQVTIVRGAGDIEPDGPGAPGHWNVSYEVWMPNRSNVETSSVNGGITIEGLEGQIRFHAQNGGVNLTDLAGDVDGTTQNGGLTVRLNGSAWRGAGLRAQTQNGGVNLSLPEGYSAAVEASTVNGGMHADFPVMLDGKTVRFDLGSGGAPVKVKTVNGGVRILKG